MSQPPEPPLDAHARRFEAQRAAGLLAEADRSLRLAIEAAEEELGLTHPTTRRLRATLTRFLAEVGRDAEAATNEAPGLGTVAAGPGVGGD